MLRLDGVAAGYGAIRALEGVSLEVPAGKIVCLLGANGAGKSTTLNCISGVVRPTGGSIAFMDEPIHRLAPDAIVKRGVVQVPEGREIFAHMTVRDNLELGAYLRRDGRAVAGDLDRVFGLFPVLRERMRQPAGTLSGGEQQMLMIGRAVMAAPKLLLLDEPSLGLSPLLVQALFDTIRQLNEGGLPILLVEQNARIALKVSAYGYILENGELRASGPAAELAEDSAIREAYLGG
jgi:branched-chain amino acid transport system ATP-binding protein